VKDECVYSISGHLSKEAELCLSCTQSFINGGAYKREFLHLEDIDWNHLIEISKRHGVLPLLYLAFHDNSSEAIPHDVLVNLADSFHKIGGHNLFMTLELLRILKLFRAHGISSIPFKGPIIAYCIWGDLSLRPFGDLDILVSLNDVTRAEELLCAEGYKPDHQLNERQQAAFLESEHHIHFLDPQRGCNVEIHWRLSRSIMPSQVDLDGLWRRAENVTVFGSNVLTMSKDDLLQVLCEHGARHTWDHLFWICDVALLMKSKDMNWPCILKWSQDAGSERTLLLGLLLAREVLGVPIPDGLSTRIRDDTELPDLVVQVINGLFAERNSQETSAVGVQTKIDPKLFYLRATDQFARKGECYLRMAFHPNGDDFSFISFPNKFFGLYYLVRPIRLLMVYRSSIIIWLLRTGTNYINRIL